MKVSSPMLAEGRVCLGGAWTEDVKWTDAHRERRRRLIEGMHLWHAAFEALAGGGFPLCAPVFAEPALALVQ